MIINNFCMLEQKVKNIIETQYNYFLSKPNVIGMGFGYKRKNDFYTCQACLQVFVKNKVSKCKLTPNSLVPPNYKGIPTDIIETGEINVCSLTERKRPLICGYGISSADYDEYGSICCLVSNGVSRFLLSTNHVLANENQFEIGKPITQPAFDFSGRPPRDIIATLNRFVPLRFNQGPSQPINYSDSALGLLTKPNILNPKVAFIGKLRGIKKTPKLNEEVRKVGCISELTTGTVQTIHAAIMIGFLSGRASFFNDQIITTPMLSPGDSGAILVNKANYGLGMGISATHNISVFCNLSLTLDQLGVHLVT